MVKSDKPGRAEPNLAGISLFRDNMQLGTKLVFCSIMH